MKRIVLVSPFPPSQNPRLVKEYNALNLAGFSVKVLYAERDQWASKHLVSSDFVLVGGKYGSGLHFFTRLVHKVAKMLLPFELNYHRASIFLLWKALRTKADLYIGHDLTSLPIAVRAAKRNDAKCGFDAEDFHRHEVSDDTQSYFYQAAKQIEDKYVGQLDFLTCASPLIAEAYKKLYPVTDPIAINNVFPGKFINETVATADVGHLRLFWFSQTIGRNRGLEAVIAAMGLLANDRVTLDLLGMINDEDRQYFQDLLLKYKLQSNQLNFIPPVRPDEIFAIAAGYDIGLALEPGFSENNRIALSNKIFTYLTAGLAIVASETPAQKRFLDENPSIGKSFAVDDIYQLSKILNGFAMDKCLLTNTKHNSKKLAKERYNWERESAFFISTVNSVI